jgi:hypothetical protein
MKELARILSANLMVDAGILTANQVHRLVGRWYRYPECCIEFFIKNYDKPDLTYVCIKECDELGRYIQCHDCWTDDNL